MPLLLDEGWFLDSGLFLDALGGIVEPPVVVASRAITTRPVSRLLVLSGVGGPAIATFEGDTRVIERGSVTVERSRTVRRRCEVTLTNPTGELTPSAPGDLFWPGVVIRIERGIIEGDTPDYLALGTFVVARFRTAMDGRLVLSGEDPLSLLAQPFGDAVVIPAGTAPADALGALWTPVLDPRGGGADWPLDGGGRTMPLRAFLPDEDRLDAVVRYFAASGLEVFADRLGRPLMRPTVDLTAAASVAVIRDFVPGDEAILLSLQRTSGRRTYNRVIVESTNPGGPDLRVVLDVSDPDSPIHRDRIGLQTAPIFRSAQVPDLAAMGDVARALLVEYALSADTLSGSAVPDITLDAGDIVTIEEPVSGTSGRYRLDSLTLPVVDGAMSLSAGKVVPLLLTGDES